jgi:hypothetical protein
MLIDRAPTSDVPPAESNTHHEEGERNKVIRYCFLQERTELEFWAAIDKLGDYGQKHELLLQRISSRQWKLFVLVLASLLLQIAYLIPKMKVWIWSLWR